MYAPFFGLAREPFSLAPDPRFLFMSDQHREALAHLLYGVQGGGGFVLLTGEIGAGKTTVTRCFLEQLPQHCVVAYIFNPCLTALELLQTVCAEFHIPTLAAGASIKAHVDALNAFLLDAHAKGRHALLIVDEAQALEPPLLEQLRLLTNLETSQRKLLQIILIGQPELRDRVDGPGMEQLSQRVIARYHLGPLSAKDTREYVKHRLSVAGPHVPVPFDTAALSRMHKLTGGVPRRINLLADRALLGAYGRGQRVADMATVERAAGEVFSDKRQRQRKNRRRWAEAATAGLSLTLVAGGLWLAFAPRSQAPEVAAQGASTSSAASTASASLVPVPDQSAAANTAAAASVAATGALPRTPASESPAALLAAAPADEAQGWRELSLYWNVAIGDGEPCAAAARAQLACYRSTGGLQGVRQLDRPALLTLRDPGGQRVFAQLLAVADDRAILNVGRQRVELTLPALARVWRGEFATFWRTPPGWRTGADGNPPPALSGWLVQQLGGGPAAGPVALRERVAAFQLAQGLQPDGRPGPVTLMQLNRVAGVDEPHLAPSPNRTR
jgi:general secretion pathway protein A